MINAKSTIGFIGMTHLGLNSSVAAAEKGYQVICYDPDTELIESLVNGNLPISEPKLDELLKKNHKNIIFSPDLTSLQDCDLIYVAPDVSTDEIGKSDLTRINYLLDLVLNAKSANQIVVILSQVPPGFTRQKIDSGDQIYYQVETLIFGQAIDRALYPERFIVGCFNPDQELPKIYQDYLSSYCCPILRMNYESAELAKISINMFLVASVSTTNTLAELCESIGANWSEIIPALRLDRRIGEYAYLNPGLGISGGNLERDLATVIKLSEKHKTESGVVAAWQINSRYRKNWIWNAYKRMGLCQEKNLRIGVLGLSYKENTHSVKNSPALEFISKLSGCYVIAYDPLATNEGVPRYVQRAKSIKDVVIESDVLVLATAWPEFRSISIDLLNQYMPGDILIDPYGLLPKNELKSCRFKYMTLGSPMPAQI